MSRITFGSSLLLCLLAAIANAAVVEVPLPGLLGPYGEGSPGRTVAIHLPDPPGLIHSASLRISGTQVTGSIVCEWGGPYPWPMQFFAEMQDPPDGWWMASPSPPEDAETFTQTALFTKAFANTTWTFLMDGDGELTFHGSPAGLVGLCFMDPVPPTGEITEAVFIIDAEFPIATEASTWGKIKALYRN